MKKTLSLLAFALLAVSPLQAAKKKTAAPAPAAQPAAPAAQADPMAQMMAMMMKNGTPNEHHKMLDALAGSWDTTVSSWMKPGDNPMVTTGVSSNQWIFGGRFLREDFKGQSMMGNMPFEGMGILGYDNVKGEYETFWLDNMATGVMTGSGQFDATGKVYMENASMSCPMTGQKDMKTRDVITLQDKDHFTYEMFTNGPDGKEFRSMLIVYSRQAAPAAPKQ